MIVVTQGELDPGQPGLAGRSNLIVADVSEDWELLASFVLDRGGPAAFADERFAWVFDDGIVRTLDLETMQLSADGPSYFGDGDFFAPWRVSPDGTRVLELGACGVGVFALPTWNRIAELPWSGGVVEAGCDGSSAYWISDTEVVVRDSNSLCFWDLSTAALRAKACQLAGRNLSQTEWDQFVGYGEYVAACRAYTAPHIVVVAAGDDARGQAAAAPYEEPTDPPPTVAPAPTVLARPGGDGQDDDGSSDADLALGCAGDEDVSAAAAALWDRVAGGTFAVGDLGEVSFVDGVHDDRTNGIQFGLLDEELAAMADFDGDCRLDVAVVTRWNFGGSGTFYKLTVLVDGGEEWDQGLFHEWFDGIVHAVDVVDETVRVELATWGPADAMCCPSGSRDDVFTFEELTGG